MQDKFNANQRPIPAPDNLRRPIKFAAVGRSIMQGTAHIATAISGTMARRIAKALNHHEPNSRGI